VATPPARSAHRTAAGNTPDAVATINGLTLEVKAHKDNTAPLYFTLGQSADPVVGADGTYYLEPGEAAIWDDATEPVGPVRAVSAAAYAYSVSW
jgi:hypothetical protein